MSADGKRSAPPERAEDQQAPLFEVRDRRRFDAEGRERATEEAGGRWPPADDASGAAARGAADIPVDFSTFILSLSTSAMIHLGDAPTPEGQIERDLQLARQVIDMLGMLQEKTRGNLTADEDKLLEQVLYDLRLRFVQASA